MDHYFSVERCLMLIIIFIIFLMLTPSFFLWLNIFFKCLLSSKVFKIHNTAYIQIARWKDYDYWNNKGNAGYIPLKTSICNWYSVGRFVITFVIIVNFNRNINNANELHGSNVFPKVRIDWCCLIIFLKPP